MIKYNRTDDLTNSIMDSLTGEMTVFNERVFEFDDCDVYVTGYVEQDFRFEYSTDHFLLSGMELISRHANFDEVMIDDYAMTYDELNDLERRFEV